MVDRNFSDLVDDLATSLPGCPNAVITDFVRRSAIEVCAYTLAWRYLQPNIRLTPGVSDYAFEPPDDAEVHTILTATVNELRASIITLEQVHSLYPDFPDTDTDARSTPRFITQLSDDEFYVAPPPDGDTNYDLKMVVALKPTPDATAMDKSVFDALETSIMHRALQHLLVLPDVPWGDRELAAYHAKQYIYRANERRAAANIGVGRGTLPAKFTPLA